MEIYETANELLAAVDDALAKAKEPEGKVGVAPLVNIELANATFPNYSPDYWAGTLESLIASAENVGRSDVADALTGRPIPHIGCGPIGLSRSVTKDVKARLTEAKKCLSPPRVGRKKTEKVKHIEKLLTEGVSYDSIADRTEESVGNIRQISSRMSRKT